MANLVIPEQPQSLHLKIDRLWNGQDCPDLSCHAQVWISHSEKGLTIQAESAIRPDKKVPEASTDKPMEGLWEYDVVEVFLVAENGHYLEIELGVGGHWLVLGFDDVRHRSNSYPDVQLERSFTIGDKTWKSSIVIPWNMLPQPVKGLNAYAICGGQFLAYNPVPGEAPDYHQPAIFPRAEIEGQFANMDTSSIDDEKRRVLAALGYIPFLCFLPLLMKDKNEFLVFHARQGLVITLVAIVLAIVGPALTIFVPIIGGLIAFALNTGLALLIIVGAWKAYQGEMWELPIMGDYAKNIKL